jgi:hypothetical protein
MVVCAKKIPVDEGKSNVVVGVQQGAHVYDGEKDF